MLMLGKQTRYSGHNSLQGENEMLKKGSIVLSIWCVVNFMLAFIILFYVIVLNRTPQFCKWLLYHK